MVSKAALRSNEMRRVDLPESDDWKTLLVVYRRAKSHFTLPHVIFSNPLSREPES